MDFTIFAIQNFTDVDRAFERMYSVEVPKLRYGQNREEFEIDRSFFEEFEYTPVLDGHLKVIAEIDKATTHLDAKFQFTGEISLECDRCGEPYPHSLEFENRIVYTLDEELEFDTDEVVLIDEATPHILLANDFYDFIVLQIPLRKVPEVSIHLCDAKVLAILGLNADGTPKLEDDEEDEEDQEENEIDPRWQALKKFKNRDQ